MIYLNNFFNSPNIINFLGIELSVTTFLLIAGSVALLLFLILLVILLLMYLRKKLVIKGYLGYEINKYHLEDKILQIENEIMQIQKKFYPSRQSRV